MKKHGAIINKTYNYRLKVIMLKMTHPCPSSNSWIECHTLTHHRLGSNGTFKHLLTHFDGVLYGHTARLHSKRKVY